ncbi:MAG TPA: DNA gyrase C-terminal beta-propeller domain-containing protein, partial [Actinocrinis sp.]|nr:DNA gyrase C-terminal beta-propeller domain-containing protein [Actinocrinis sp.]
LNIDAVIQTIRTSENAANARERLMSQFELTEVQANYILDTPLRRLTRFDRLELESEKEKLAREIAELTAILESDALLRRTVSEELAKVAKDFSTPRRTTLLEAADAPIAASVPLEVEDAPCRVMLSSTGLLARIAVREGADSADDNGSDGGAAADGPRAKHDAIVSAVSGTLRGDFGVLTSAGRLVRVSAIDLPSLPVTAGPPNLAGGVPVSEFVDLAADEKALCLSTLDAQSPGVALGTLQGVVKRVVPDFPANKDEFEMIALKEGDRVVGAAELRTGQEDLVFLTTDAQLLKFSADQVRPQGRPASGMAGIKLADGASVLAFAAVDPERDALVVTVAGSSGELPGTSAGNAKVTPYQLYPSKGRATGGVRCQRFLRGEDTLVFAWAGTAPARAADEAGNPVELPPLDQRRDGSGTPLRKAIAVVAPGA